MPGAPTVRSWRATLPALALAGLLAACQHGGSGAAAPPEAAPEAWRVVEQVGVVMVRTPSAVHWTPLATAPALPPGTRVATGAHAALILARGESQLVAGARSEIELPVESTAPVVHREGNVRYRAAATPWMAVQAGSLTLTAERAVFTLAARADATALEVEAGEVRINEPDSPSRRLAAGQHAVVPNRIAPPPVIRQAAAATRPAPPNQQLPEPLAAPVVEIPSEPFVASEVPAPIAVSLAEAPVGPVVPDGVGRSVTEGPRSAPGEPEPVEAVATDDVTPSLAVGMTTASRAPSPVDASFAADDAPYERLVRGLLAGVAEAAPAAL